MRTVTYREADALRDNADHPHLPISGTSYPRIADENGFIRVSGPMTRTMRVGEGPPWPRAPEDSRRRYDRHEDWVKRVRACRECGAMLRDGAKVIAFSFFPERGGDPVTAYIHAAPCPGGRPT
jgi:hypothetical protein